MAWLPPQTHPPAGRGTPALYPIGAFGASILAPTALDTHPISNINRRHWMMMMTMMMDRNVLVVPSSVSICSLRAKSKQATSGEWF